MDKTILRGKTILVIETNAFDASRLAAALEGAGAEVIVAARRVDAVSIAADGQVSAAVLDSREQELSDDTLTGLLHDLRVPHFAFAGRLPIAKSAHAPALRAPRPPAEEIVMRLVELLGLGAQDGATFAPKP